MEEIIRVIIDEFRSKPIPNIVARYTHIPIDSGKIISVIGPRRVGKSTLFFQILNQLLEHGVPSSQIFYFNLEDERLFDLKVENLDDILKACRQRTNAPLDQCYFFFDEIQIAPQWDKFIRRIYDSISKNIILSGSNAKLLSSEIPTHLRGRTLVYTIWPLTLTEYCLFKSIVSPNSQDLLAYIHYGGFPEIVLQADKSLKIMILQEYFNTMIYRDILERFNKKVSNGVIFKLFVHKLVDSAAKSFSINKIHKQLKSSQIDVSMNTPYDFLDICQASYVIHIVEKFHHKPLIRKTGDRKVYMIDAGYLTALKTEENLGVKLEHPVLHYLNYQKKQAISFYKDVYECDFVYKEKDGFEAIQVALELKNEDTKKREIRGLLEACKKFNLTQGTIVTLLEKEAFVENGVTVSVVPFKEWAKD